MIEIRPVIEADVETFYLHQADPEASAMAVFASRDRASHFEHWRKIAANPDLLARAVLVGGQVAGNVASWPADGRRLVAYWIGREFWGRGVGTQALRLFVAEIKVRPLFAEVVVTNPGSQRVLEKSGFTRIEQRPSPDDGLEEFVYRLD